MKSVTLRSPRKRKGHGVERRQEILAAALDLFSERGVHAVSTRQIAEAAGLSQPALYAYFPTRDDITAELCEQAFQLLRARIEERNAGAVPSAESFARMCRTYIDFGLEHPNDYRVAFMIEKALKPKPDEAGPNRTMLSGIETFGAFREVMGRFVAAGLTFETDVEAVTQSLWAGLHGLVSLIIARSDFPWADRETLIETHIVLLRRGVLKG
jgi:AcrR family transcriptional regulator